LTLIRLDRTSTFGPAEAQPMTALERRVWSEGSHGTRVSSWQRLNAGPATGPVCAETSMSG